MCQLWEGRPRAKPNTSTAVMLNLFQHPCLTASQRDNEAWTLKRVQGDAVTG